jgi:hypothetical protein
MPGTPPGGSELFGGGSFLISPSFDGTSVAFWGENRTGDRSGIFTNAGGVLRTVADTNTSVPGLPVQFSGFGDVPFTAIDAGNVLFVGTSRLPSGAPLLGVYLDVNGDLSKVFDSFDLALLGLDPQQEFALDLEVYHQALEGGQLAFLLQTNRAEYIIVASVSEAPSIVLVLIGLLALALFDLTRAQVERSVRSA